MRIIAGNAGGIPLHVPRSLTRPTTDRVREAVFSSLGERVDGAAVLDLYAGSGALGLEALSRGAGSATFVDEQRAACDAVQANLSKARLGGAEIVCRTVQKFLQQRFGVQARNRCAAVATGGADKGGGFDLIFADPPYARDSESTAEIEALLSDPALMAALKADGVLMIESLARAALPLSAESGWSVVRERRYGDTLVSFLRKEAGS